MLQLELKLVAEKLSRHNSNDSFVSVAAASGEIFIQYSIYLMI